MRESTPARINNELYALANKASGTVFSYPGMIVNGIKFVVYSRDVKLKTQNCGVMVPSEDSVNYYGVLEEIIQLSYLNGCSVYLFKCKWFNTSRIKVESNITSVYVKEECYKDDPFILASQAKLIYYLRDIKNENDWRIVNEYIPRNVWDFSDMDIDDIDTADDIPILQEVNSSGIQLWVELPIFDSLQYDRVDLNPTEVHNVDDFVGESSDDENVNDDIEFEDDTLAEYEDDEDENNIVYSDSDSDVRDDVVISDDDDDM